jgi:hypothetical protein
MLRICWLPFGPQRKWELEGIERDTDGSMDWNVKDVDIQSELANGVLVIVEDEYVCTSNPR